MKGYIKIDVNEDQPADGVKVCTDVGNCYCYKDIDDDKYSGITWFRTKDYSIIVANCFVTFFT